MKKGVGKFVKTTFDIGLSLKAIDALAEIALGLGLIFLTPEALAKIVDFAAGGILANGLMKGRLAAFSVSYTSAAQHFAVFYMLSHGILKITVIALLWKEKLWAYPFSIAVFVLFIVYQVYHYTKTHSVLLIILTILDIIMIILTVAEYKRLKALKESSPGV